VPVRQSVIATGFSAVKIHRTRCLCSNWTGNKSTTITTNASVDACQVVNRPSMRPPEQRCRARPRCEWKVLDWGFGCVASVDIYRVAPKSQPLPNCYRLKSCVKSVDRARFFIEFVHSIKEATEYYQLIVNILCVSWCDVVKISVYNTIVFETWKDMEIIVTRLILISI